MWHAQRGVSLLLVAVVLILIVGAILAFLALFGTSHKSGSVVDTAARLAKAQAALEQFASATERLPCPADPTSGSGDEYFDVTSTDCHLPADGSAGTIPWRTIGLRADDALDAWGSKISYSVYSGATGLTQPHGASMVPCTIGALTVVPLVNGLCQVDGGGYHTDASLFPNGKGLTVQDAAGNVLMNPAATPPTGAAYVLVSHGPSGLGAYTSSNAASPSPPLSNVDERSNALANATAGHFVDRPASLPGAANSFDDLIVYRSILDLATKANLVARNWANTTLNSATVTAAVSAQAGHAVSVNPGDSIGPSLNINNATITAQAAGVAENLTFDNAAGLDGIGGVGGSGTALSSADSEVLHVAFNTTAQMFAVTLNGFGCRPTTGSCTDFDVVQLTFSKAGVPVGSPITKQACNSLNVASFTIDLGASPGGDFDGVDIAPQPTSPSAGATQILVGGYVNCPEGAVCVTTLDSGSGPGGNHCP